MYVYLLYILINCMAPVKPFSACFNALLPCYRIGMKLLWIKVASLELPQLHRSQAEGNERERLIEEDGTRRRWKRSYVVITFRIDLNFPRFHIHQQVIRIVDEGDKFSLLMGLFPSWHECWGRMHLGGEIWQRS